MTEFGRDESCVDLAMEDKRCLLISNELKCEVGEVVEDGNWKYKVLDSVGGLLSSDKAAKVMKRIGEDGSCEDIAV